MLHILLLILKIIGIILAVILGIIILLLGIILFVPIRYEVTAQCGGTIDTLKAKVKATWFLHLLRADVLMKGKKLKWQVRAAWIRKSSAMIFGGETDEKSDKSKEKKSHKESKEMEQTTEKDKTVEEVAETRDEEHKAASEEKSETDTETNENISEENEKKSVRDKLKEKYEKIKKAINDLLQKKERITDFLTDEVHIRAFKKLKKGVIILIKRLKPKCIRINMRFGFEDPGTTGRVAAALAVMYPFLGETSEIVPDFSEKVLEGKIYLKGRIRICHFASLAMKLLLSKDVRMSYKDIRNFKL